MRLISTHIFPSPQNRGFVRLTAEIQTDTTDETRLFWFDIPSQLEQSISDAGDPWAILMLPWACKIGEPIHLSAPVDALLVDNLRGLQRMWRSWYPDLSQVDIIAPIRANAPADLLSPKKTAAFFSGGIDSLFTLVRHNDELRGDGSSLIDDLICVAGFNTSLEDFEDLQNSLRPMADRFGKTLVPIATNIRYSRQTVVTPYSDGYLMNHLAHGAALAAIASILGKRYKEIYIAATHSYEHLIPWGSHPLTDPLCSSRGLRITHDATSFSRVERTTTVAECDTALEVLHVCWQDLKKGNCSRCQKCLRTMSTLDLLGAKDRGKTFDWSHYSVAALSRVWLHDRNDVNYFVEIADAARQKGRADIADAAMSSVRYSLRKQRVLRLINSNPLSRGGWQAIKSVRAKVRAGPSRMAAISHRMSAWYALPSLLLL